MCIADRLLVRTLQAEVVERDAERSNADRRQLSQVHWGFAEDARIDSLVEIDATLYRDAPGPLQLRSRREPEIANFCHELAKLRRRHDVVVHEDEVFLDPVQLIDSADDRRQ